VFALIKNHIKLYLLKNTIDLNRVKILKGVYKMKKQQYSVLDHTAQVFLNTLVFTNDGDAIRWFTTVVNDPKEETNISKYPEQFTLYRLADFDDKTGLFVYDELFKPKQLITGIQVQDTEKQKFSLKDMLNMLKEEMERENIITKTTGELK
jgi:Cys-tRNA synthase (O-phospho-L-seryl-tRNA:Cys-tRNA synthase)